MSCIVCESAVVGQNYIVDGTCHDCGTKTECVGEYKGMEGADHYFRLHPPVVCRGCNKIRDFSLSPCKNIIDVTEEFQVMQNRKDSHWIGE